MLHKNVSTELFMNYNGELISLAEPKIMAILNVTPDSFYDGDSSFKPQDYLTKVEKMITDGADIIDVGGMSTKPGAKEITAEEEANRVLPILKILIAQFPAMMFSIDTYRSSVAEQAIKLGVGIVNDISGGTFDDKMYGVIKKYQCVYIVMHIQGTPATMQNDPSYHNVITEVVKKLSEIKFKLVKDGVNDIIIDPGFGFGKSIEQNYEILNKLAQFKLLGLPILVGFSRKSMIYKVLQQEAKDALNGTSVLNTFALLNGANIIRVHDVKEAKECAILVSKLKANSI